MPTTDREVPQVVVNKLTQAQYNSATKSQDEFYLVTDAKVEASDTNWSTFVDKIYPVGSIYMSATLSTAAAVGTALGGTWVAWGAGRVPVGVDTSDADFDTAEKTGGEKTHALGELEVPGFLWHTDPNTRDTLSININSGSTYGCKAAPQSKTGNAHNNLQPYITCYMYKRTA